MKKTISTRVNKIMLNYIVVAMCLLILQCENKGTNTEDDPPTDSLNEYSHIDTINYEYAESLFQSDSMVYNPCNFIFPNEANARILIWQSGMPDTLLDTTANGISIELSDGLYDLKVVAQNYITDTTYYSTMIQQHQSCYFSVGLFCFTDVAEVNWDSLYIGVWGFGAPDPKDPIPVQRAGALRVAKQMFQKNALYHIGQLHYAPDSTYENLILKYQNIRNNIRSYVNKIQIMEVIYLSDGNVSIYHKIPLTGKNGLSKEIFK